MPPRRPFDCPVCGTPVPTAARACPHCGADERTGWDEDATRYDGLDLPEAEPAENPARRRRDFPWKAVAALLLGGIAATLLRELWRAARR